jgi:hypothetical protein
MDSKVFRMALLTIISVILLVAVIVYATNADKINGLIGKKTAAPDEGVAEASFIAPETVYGEQIGDNLNGFLYDEDFFDETEKIPSVVVIKQASSLLASEDTSDFTEFDEDDIVGTGMAVVGQLDNAEAAATTDSAGSQASSNGN